ncbi:hypothetical protein C8Q74DRAFT_377485 [Fomes fomentarius]|nr:hypothetical protein C8Q74DRAFT_377485 [Fomes fomentarius]
MHLPYKDLNLSSKVPWFHPVTPMETGADEGLQFVMKHTAKKFKDDIKNYLEGEKTHVTSDQANESEYVPKRARQRLQPEENPSRPPHGTATATVSSVTSDIILAVTTAPSVTPTVTTTATSETVQSLAPAVVAPMSSTTIHPRATSHSSPGRVRFKTTPPMSRGNTGGAASTDLVHLMGAVVCSGQLPQDARPPVRQKRKGRVSDSGAADLEANVPKKRPKASSATGEGASAASVPNQDRLSGFLVVLESKRQSVSVCEPISTPPASNPPPHTNNTVYAPALSATQRGLPTSTTVTVSSDTPAVEDAPSPTPDVSQSHPSVSQPQADHLPVAHDQSPGPEGTAPSEAVDRDGCDLDAGILADLEGSDADNATGTNSRGGVRRCNR